MEHVSLRHANQTLRAFLAKCPAPDSGDFSQLPGPAEVESLAQQLRAVGALIAEPGSPVARSTEFSDYVQHLRQLHELFTRLEPALFAERERLNLQRRQIVAARAWAAALKSTR
jgi:hypothetical protein